MYHFTPNSYFLVVVSHYLSPAVGRDSPGWLELVFPFLGGISDSLGVGYGLIDMCLQVIDLYLKVGTTYDVIFITAAL